MVVLTAAATLVDCGSMALSGTLNLNIPLQSGVNKLVVFISCKYAAMAGTSGLQVAFNKSIDGTTFVASAKATQVNKPSAATVLQTISQEFGISDIATRADAGPLAAYRLVMTNLDATNAVVYSVSYKFE